MNDDPLPSSPRDWLIEIGRVAVAPTDVKWQFARGSGPGGQNVNKVNTKAELWLAVDDIDGLTGPARDRLRQLAGRRLTADDRVHLASDESRSQEGNRQAVIERLREKIVQAMHEPKVRRKTRPTYSSKQRRLTEKKRRGETKSNRRAGGRGGEG